MKIYQSSHELFVDTLHSLYINPEFKSEPRGMFCHETLGFNARITDPLNRLIFSPLRKWHIGYALGEFLWYITGSDSLDFISYYAPSYDRFSDDGETLYGAYGKRLLHVFDPDNECYFSSNAIESVIRKLNYDPDSRQAIALIWENKDMHVKKTKDLPCTVFLQFFLREDHLHMVTNMRSNDVWLGATNDIFCFTLLQEYIAWKLGVPLGYYVHNAGSMHLYQNNIEKVKVEDVEKEKRATYSPGPMKHFDFSKLDELIELNNTLMQKDNFVIEEKLDNDFAYILSYNKWRNDFTKNKKDPIMRKEMCEILSKEILSQIKDNSIVHCIEIKEGLA